MFDHLDWNIILPSLFTLIGVLTGQVIVYYKQKTERIDGINIHKAENARKDQELKDQLRVINEKLDSHNIKLDKHNGFEGRIIRLETLNENIANLVHHINQTDDRK